MRALIAPAAKPIAIDLCCSAKFLLSVREGIGDRMAIVLLQDKASQTRSVTARVRSSTVGPVTTKVVDAEQLLEYEDAWSALARTAAVPNAFYEPWMLLPAIEHLGENENLQFMLVFGPAGKSEIGPLWGLFPLRVEAKCLNRLPIRTLAFWAHRYCFLSVPLIDSEHMWEVLDVFWRWFENNPFRCLILDTNLLLSEGPFQVAWSDFAIGRSTAVISEYPRALIEPRGATEEQYIANVISKKHQDEFIRQERRLSEIGQLVYGCIDDLADVESWADEFLQLEASGWKGANGGALASRREDAAYFRAILRQGFARNRVILLSLSINGKPIAMKCNLLTDGAGFAFKIAHDERYAKYSPGTLLELENIRRLCRHPRIKWMDSCAMPRHPLANRVWSERRMIRHALFSANSRLADFLVAAVPVSLWLNKQLKRRTLPSYSRTATQPGG